jgi:methionyl-tRNA synthetase
MKDKVLITAALPYANGPLHFGHIAGAYLPSDVYARFRRLKGDQVAFICGSDEYGVAITISAEKAGRTPKEHVDLFHAVNKAFFEKLNISFDHYSRTTNPYHADLTQRFFLDLYEQGYIEAHVTNQLYSEKEKRFLADRYVIGTCPKCAYDQARGDECPSCGHSYEACDLKHPRSKVTGDHLVLKPTKHWFLRYDMFKSQLKDWIEAKNWKPNVVNFAKNYIDDLKMRAVTRDSDWGVKVPLDDAEGKVMYVWFDAPIGYLSATIEWAHLKKDPSLFESFWCDSATELVQFVGKDNIPFHAVFFPAMIMGQKPRYKLVDQLPANEFYMLEGRQFSKSEGWTIDLEDFFSKYSVDQIRYMIAASAPESQDSEFTWKEFQTRSNAELLGKLGNFVHRVITFVNQHMDGVVPSADHLLDDDRDQLEKVRFLAHEASLAYSAFSLRKATSFLMEIATSGNVFFDHKKPWALKKDLAQRAALNSCLYTCLEIIKILALVSNPIIPESAARILHSLGLSTSIKSSWDEFIKTPLVSGAKLNTSEVLFRKIEDSEIANEIAKLNQMSHQSSQESLVSIDEFKKLDIAIAEVIQVDDVPGSDKLYKLQVSDGQGKRQVVAGIKEAITKEELLGKQVLILRNLEKAIIRGVESQGMILALKEGKHIKPLTLDGFKLGAKLS